MTPRPGAGTTAALVVLLAAAALGPSASGQPGPQRTVLAIHWGAEEFPGTAVLDAAIRESLEPRPDATINYFTEYLESEAFPASSAALRDYIGRKYSGRRIDLVIANTTPSLEFALDYRRDLFPDAPIVFLAGSLPPGVADRTVSGVTGVLSDVAFAETLTLALALHPGVQRVYVVAQAPTESAYPGRVQAELDEFSEQVELNYIREKSVPDLLAAIKAIPPRSLILYTRFTPEDALSVSDTVEVARLMARISPVPIYGPTALYMGTGIVGGVMRQGADTGARIGQIARQILDGTAAGEIPVETVRRVPTFDWRQVQRWGIDPARLPPGSDVQFRVPTPWESARRYLLPVAIVVAAQMLLIAGLLTQRARRRRAEKRIRSSEATLRKSYERSRHLAGRLIHAQEAARASIARDLHDDVCQQLVYVTMAMCSLKGSSGEIQAPETQKAFSDLERDTLRMFDAIRRLSHDLHPASLRLLGLAPALKAHCQEVERRHDVRVSFTARGELGTLHADVSVCFFRIAQEALRNGLVHGSAQQFDVLLARSGAEVDLSVTDDGRGFDLEAVRQAGGGLGLVSMGERAYLVGAGLQIVTAPGRGTSIHVRGPVDPSLQPGSRDAGSQAEIVPAELFPVGP